MNREDLKNKSLEIYVYAQESSNSCRIIGGICLNTGLEEMHKWAEVNQKEADVWAHVIEHKKVVKTFELELKNISKIES